MWYVCVSCAGGILGSDHIVVAVQAIRADVTKWRSLFGDRFLLKFRTLLETCLGIRCFMIAALGYRGKPVRGKCVWKCHCCLFTLRRKG